MVYCRVDIATSTRETGPVPLPQGFSGLAVRGKGSLADLSWTAPNFDSTLVGKGYWPVVDRWAQLAELEQYAVLPEFTVDAVAEVVYADYKAVPLSADDMKTAKKASIQAQLASTDARMTQATEEMLVALLANGVVTSGDISPDVKAAVQARADLRQQLADLG